LFATATESINLQFWIGEKDSRPRDACHRNEIDVADDPEAVGNIEAQAEDHGDL
jgi:hypothetical protein